MQCSAHLVMELLSYFSGWNNQNSWSFPRLVFFLNREVKVKQNRTLVKRGSCPAAIDRLLPASLALNAKFKEKNAYETLVDVDSLLEILMPSE